MTAPPRQPRVTIRIASRFAEIDLVDRLASAWLAFQGLRAEQRDPLALGLREAVANAVRHGNKLDPEKTVEITFERRNNDFVFRVEDEGEGFDPQGVPDPLAPENLLRSTGRGILMMRAYADEVEFLSGGTIVELRKATAAPRSAEEE